MEALDELSLISSLRITLWGISLAIVHLMTIMTVVVIIFCS